MKYTVEIEVKQAEKPGDSVKILQLCAGEYQDAAGAKYSLETLPEIIANLLDWPGQPEWRKMSGVHILKKPHKTPAWTSLYHLLRTSSLPQGSMFWGELARLVKVRVRQAKEKANDTSQV